jgi:hypothetical protein
MNTVKDINIVEIVPGVVELSAGFLGQTVYFRLPEEHFFREAVGDALLLAVLAPAMRTGSAIRIPAQYPVSRVLIEHLDGIQDIWQSWNGSLNKVSLDAFDYYPAPVSDGTALFYAGGVDSTYSLLSHEREIMTLISAVGFDFNLPRNVAEQVRQKNMRFAQKMGKQFIHVETNISRFVFNLGISRTFVFGAALACMGVLTGQKRCLVASSHSAANLKPEGSHPVLDHLFSNGITEFVHDATVSRLRKTLTIAQNPEFLANLHVCWDQAGENCGRCSKCVRTMMALKLAGVQGPFHGELSVKLLKEMAAVTDYEYVVELVVGAHQAGDSEAVRAMKKGLRHHDFRDAVGSLDRAFFGGRVKRYLRNRSSEPEDLVLVELRPDINLK